MTLKMVEYLKLLKPQASSLNCLNTHTSISFGSYIVPILFSIPVSTGAAFHQKHPIDLQKTAFLALCLQPIIKYSVSAG